MHNIDDVAAAIVASTGPIDAMKLQKLVYYCQAWHLAITSEPLFLNGVEAWKDGPVVKELWDQHKGARSVSAWPSGDRHNLPYEKQRFIELVCAEYSPLTGDELSERTHDEPPWKSTRGDLPSNVGSSRVISRSLMAEYFRGQMLGGQSSIDLAVGGIMLAPRPSETDEVALNDELERIRDEYRGEPDTHPSDVQQPVVGIGQWEQPTAEDFSDVARIRSRSRH